MSTLIIRKNETSRDMVVVLLIFSVVVVVVVDSYPAFYIRIPNGDKVPHVCPPETTTTTSAGDVITQRWPAVGHWQSKSGESPRRGSSNSLNPFGRDFAANNFQWTPTLCRLDSDQDGLTNGQELGDPDCVWTMTSHQPPPLNATSHPGICEPIDSKRCAEINAPLATECPNQIEAKPDVEQEPESDEDACPAISNSLVHQHDLRLTNGPAEILMTEEATRDAVHFCQAFTLPADQPYHIIAVTPIVSPDDSFFISHVTVHACTDQADSFNLAAIGGLNKPSKTACQLLKPCGKLVGTWKFNPQVKVPIVCLSPLFGIRFGEDRFEKIVVDFYYAFKMNHPNVSQPIIDVASSGISLYYTAKLRRYDLGMLLVGENFVRLPPGHAAWNVSVDLPSTCLAKLATSRHTLTPSHATLHGNRFFQSIQLSVTTMGQSSMGAQLLAEVTRDEIFGQPYAGTKIGNTVVRSLDGLSLRCTYDTESLDTFTFYGPPPDGEMCFAAISFYPADNSTWFIDATQMGELNACPNSTIINGCPIAAFAKQNQEVIKDLRQDCDSGNYPPVSCPTGCKTLMVRENLLGHDCLVGDVFQKLVRTPELTSLVPFTPFEATTVASTIDLCRLEIYAIVIEKSGLKYQLNRTRIESEIGLAQVKPCQAGITLISPPLVIYLIKTLLLFIIS